MKRQSFFILIKPEQISREEAHLKKCYFDYKFAYVIPVRKIRILKSNNVFVYEKYSITLPAFKGQRNPNRRCSRKYL